jgi:hypothetical protein
MFQAFCHIRGDRGGDNLGPLGPLTGKIRIHSADKSCQPTLEVLRNQGPFSVELAVDIHGMTPISRFAQEQFAPIILDMGKMNIEIHRRNIQEDRGKQLIGENPFVEQVDKRFDILSAVEVGSGAGCKLGIRHGEPD